MFDGLYPPSALATLARGGRVADAVAASSPSTQTVAETAGLTTSVVSGIGPPRPPAAAAGGWEGAAAAAATVQINR